MNSTSMSMNGKVRRLVVVSNRLPIVLSRTEDGGWDVRPGSGGLVTALAPVLRDRGGTWIGWPGTSDASIGEDTLREAAGEAGYRLVPVILPLGVATGYYHGFSNEIIWPLFHDIPSRCSFQPAYWEDYQRANRCFALAVADETTERDWVWVHDYHLMLLAEELRAAGVTRRTGFFLHIPFPTVDMFLKLPWRFQVLHALMEYDVIGFQTLRDTRNFVACTRALMPGVRVSRVGESYAISFGGRNVRVGAFPISIDFRRFARGAASDEVRDTIARTRDHMPNMRVVLGIDRLDYTKGLPERLTAFQEALRRYPELQGTVTLLQVVIPSRQDVPDYQALKRQIERMVGEINGEFTEPGWVPIHYLYRSLEQTELLAYYRLADVCLITPLRDGMNLVSKEYCACNLDGDGVLILSEFAGSAAQLRRGALLVNPHDVIGTADAIRRALTMPQAERRARMRQMRRSIERTDIFWWTESFLRAALSKRLDEFPIQEEYAPRDDSFARQFFALERRAELV